MRIHEGEMLTDELLRRARQAAKRYNERLAVLIRQSIRQEEFIKSAPEIRKTFIPPIDNAVNIVVYDPASPPERIRVEGREHMTKLIEKSTPGERLPDGERGSGVVKLAIVIGKDGTVNDVDPLAGPKALISPAVDAVRRWKYQPTLLNGRPVEVETTVDVAFPPEE